MFEVETQYTFQDYLALNRLSAKTYRRGRTILFRLLTGVTGLFFLLIALLMLLTDAEGTVLTWLFVGFVGLWLMLTAILINHIQAMQTRRMVMDGVRETRFRFEEDAFYVVTAKQTSVNPYSSLHSLFCYQGRYFLCMDKRHAFILPCNGLASGEREAFEAFLSQKSGREWNVLHTGAKDDTSHRKAGTEI